MSPPRSPLRIRDAGGCRSQGSGGRKDRGRGASGGDTWGAKKWVGATSTIRPPGCNLPGSEDALDLRAAAPLGGKVRRRRSGPCRRAGGEEAGTRCLGRELALPAHPRRQRAAPSSFGLAGAPFSPKRMLVPSGRKSQRTCLGFPRWPRRCGPGSRRAPAAVAERQGRGSPPPCAARQRDLGPVMRATVTGAPRSGSGQPAGGPRALLRGGTDRATGSPR